MGYTTSSQGGRLFLVDPIFIASGGCPTHNTLFVFHGDTQVEVAALKQRLEAQANTLSWMEKTWKKLRSRINLVV